MKPIISVSSTPAPGFERQQWTRVIVRRDDRDWEIECSWDIENDARDIDLFMHPVGHPDQTDFYTVAVIGREFDEATSYRRVRIVENAILRAVSETENNVVPALSHAIHEHEALLDAGRADSEDCKVLMGRIQHAFQELGLDYNTQNLAGCGSRRAIEYMHAAYCSHD